MIFKMEFFDVMMKLITIFSLLCICSVITDYAATGCPRYCTCTYSSVEYLHRIVSCSGPELTSFPRDIPADTKLLFLEGTRVRSLGPGMVDYLPELWDFSAMQNRFTKVAPGFFAGLRKLKTIVFKRCKFGSSEDVKNLLCSIESKVPVFINFSGVFTSQFVFEKNVLSCLRAIQLENFIFDGNQVVLPAGTFAGLSIEMLSLDHVFYETFDSAIFNGSKNISTLFLQKNDLREFPSFMVNGSSVLPLLRKLYLNDNMISTWKNSPFTGLSSLSHLDISDNTGNIKVKENVLLANIPNITYLNLARSDIYTDVDANTDGSCIFASTTLRTIDLTKSNKLSHLYDVKPNASFFNFACAQNLKILLLTDFCQKLDIRSGCRFTFQFGLRDLNYLEKLDLRSNQLVTLSHDMFRGLRLLKHLNLEGNKLSGWGESTFKLLRSLNFLDLRDNYLTRISRNYFPLAFLLHLDTFDITKNPFECNCDLLWLTKLIVILNQSLVAPDNLLCAGPKELKDKPILTYKPDYNICLRQTFGMDFYFIILSSAFLVILSLSFSYGYKYRWHIRFFWFNLWTKYQHLSEADDVRAYEYDVFLSYNRRDLPWVKDEFLPVVEDEFGLCACLHDRDWLAGVDIVDNIFTSITNSKKIVLIISNAFACSQWCQLELTMAQHHLFEKDKNSIILIILEEINSINMTPRLLLQMKTKTYIPWTGNETGRKLFFRKVKKALGCKAQSFRMQTV